MGTHRKDPRQMTDRERRLNEFKMSHRRMDLSELKGLERSLMLCALVFLADGPCTPREMYLDGEFYHCSELKNKLKQLEDMGLVMMVNEKGRTMVMLTEQGLMIAMQLKMLLNFLKTKTR